MSGYLMPSQCDRCCPVVWHSDDATHYAHESDCIHARKDTTK